jgi:hypothetical protein
LKVYGLHETALGVGYATAEGGYGFCFVGEGRDGVNQAREFEDFFHVAGGIEDFQATALALEADEGAHECADAGTIDLRDAGEIDDNIGRAGIGKLAQLYTERIIAGADDDATYQIENSHVPGFSRRDLQAHDSLLAARECAAARMNAGRQDYLRQ